MQTPRKRWPSCSSRPLLLPRFTPDALERLQAKKNLRLIEIEAAPNTPASSSMCPAACCCRMPTASAPLRNGPEGRDRASAHARKNCTRLLFAWRVCKHVKSNAIVYARDGQTARRRRRPDEPRGRGEIRRHESRSAAQRTAWPPPTPSSRSPTAWRRSPRPGATAVIQPGGSVRDDEVIAAADKLGIAMVFTGIRHFRH